MVSDGLSGTLVVCTGYRIETIRLEVPFVFRMYCADEHMDVSLLGIGLFSLIVMLVLYRNLEKIGTLSLLRVCQMR